MLISSYSCNKGLFNTEELPEVDFSIEVVGCTSPPCQVQFINKTTGANNYEWDFGDGTSKSFEENPVHIYDSIATYKVTLKALNENGESSKSKDLVLDGSGGSGVIDNEKPFWLYGGGYYYPESYRNHHYSFEVKGDNSQVDINLESQDIDVYLWLYDPLNELVNQNGGDRAASLSETLNKGKYTVVAGSSERGAIGNYTIDLEGNTTGLTKIESTNLKSDNEQWNTGGGGYYDAESLRNHIYTFDVTENNSAVDIRLESSDSEVYLELISPTQSLEKQYGNKGEKIVYTLNAGNYKIIAGTYE
ncbi:MAG: PKD domain-containing protein, partial [Saprospiraceae bacterium]|nr:PKD domain-containing protein [Saprospiraceae bacterium]